MQESPLFLKQEIYIEPWNDSAKVITSCLIPIFFAAVEEAGKEGEITTKCDLFGLIGQGTIGYGHIWKLLSQLCHDFCKSAYPTGLLVSLCFDALYFVYAQKKML